MMSFCNLFMEWPSYCNYDYYDYDYNCYDGDDYHDNYLPPTMEEVYVFVRTPRVRLSVCVQDYSKTRAWIWMKCCVSTDVGTWTNWLAFEADPDYSPDAGFLSPTAMWQHRILLRREESHASTGIGGPSKQQRAWFWGVKTLLSEVNALYRVHF